MPANDDIFEETLMQQLNTFRIEGSIRNQVISDLTRLEKKIVAKISEIDPETGSSRRLNKLLKSVRKLIQESMQDINKELESKLLELATIESRKQGAILDDNIKAELVATALSNAQINSLYKDTLINGAPSSEWWSRQSEALINAFTDNMRQGLLSGETNDQLIRRVRGTKALNYRDGIMFTSKNNAEALVRSSVSAVSNQARLDIMEFNSNVVGSLRHVSTLDGRTSTECMARDGLRWDAKTKEPIGHTVPFRVPPIHWNCRSSLVAEVKGTRLPDDAERASMDGPVPANTNFGDFLKSKSKAFQDELLGVGKADMWRKGKITLAQLLDQRGNPLTLSELQERYN